MWGRLGWHLLLLHLQEEGKKKGAPFKKEKEKWNSKFPTQYGRRTKRREQQQRREKKAKVSASSLSLSKKLKQRHNTTLQADQGSLSLCPLAVELDPI